jgi:hypothetical protein
MILFLTLWLLAGVAYSTGGCYQAMVKYERETK